MKTVNFNFRSNQYVISFDAAAKRLVVTMPNYRKDYARTATFPIWWEVEEASTETDEGLLNMFWEVLNAAAIGEEYGNYDRFVEDFCDGKSHEEALASYDQHQECRIGILYFRYRNFDMMTFCAEMMGALQSIIDYLREHKESVA